MKKQTAKCRLCQSDYDRAEVKRTHGEFSSVLGEGFCSAKCYADWMLQPKREIQSIIHDHYFSDEWVEFGMGQMSIEDILNNNLDNCHHIIAKIVTAPDCELGLASKTITADEGNYFVL